jgi:hypothetical protein
MLFCVYRMSAKATNVFVSVSDDHKTEKQGNGPAFVPGLAGIPQTGLRMVGRQFIRGRQLNPDRGLV